MLILPKFKDQDYAPGEKPEPQYIHLGGDDMRCHFYDDGFEQLMSAMRTRERVNRVLGSKPR